MSAPLLHHSDNKFSALSDGAGAKGESEFSEIREYSEFRERLCFANK